MLTIRRTLSTSGHSWVNADDNCRYVMIIYVGKITTVFFPIYGLCTEICSK